MRRARLVVINLSHSIEEREFRYGRYYLVIQVIEKSDNNEKKKKEYRRIEG